MPFDPAYEDTYRLGIKAAAEAEGIRAERVDEQLFHKEGILSRIYNQIIEADIIIADMTGRNANVFYEVGYAHALDKTCILLTKSVADIPFDLKHHRHIVYGSIGSLKADLCRDLAHLKSEMSSRAGPFRVESGEIFGWIDKEEMDSYRGDGSKIYSAFADVAHTILIYNDKRKVSPEIENVYFYTAAGWRYRQGNNDCPYMASDLAKYKLRHLIRLDHKRISQNSWVELKFRGRKMIDRSNSPIEKDRYGLSGKAIVRLTTSDNAYDYQIPISVECTDIPF
jgi:hypothetical protein